MRLSPNRYRQAILTESARLRDVLADADPEARVPTCPDWNTDDLLYHLFEVQTFWWQIIASGATSDEDAAEFDPPEEPETRGELFGLGEAATLRLVDELDRHDPGEQAWSWAREQTVGFTLRRQAHEATIHRIDAEVTADPSGASTPVDVDLAEDGVDEALRVHLGDVPEGATTTVRPGGGVRVVATDTGATWMVSIAHLGGTDGDGTEYDEPLLVVADDDTADGHDSPVGLFAATAEDLYRWFWRRPTLTDPKRGGDIVTVAEFERIARAADL